MNLYEENMTVARAITAVFLTVAGNGDWWYLTRLADFDGEDPEDVRCDLANAIEETLETLGIASTAENCGEATNLVLELLPELDQFLQETTE